MTFDVVLSTFVRGGSRTAATYKMEFFVIKVNGSGFCQIHQLQFFVSCNIFLIYVESKKKILQEYPSFYSDCMFWYVLFYKTSTVVLHLGDNGLLSYFDICIKFRPSTIISTMKKR